MPIGFAIPRPAMSGADGAHGLDDPHTFRQNFDADAVAGNAGHYSLGVAYFAARISRSCTRRSGSEGSPLMFHALNTTTIS